MHLWPYRLFLSLQTVKTQVKCCLMLPYAAFHLGLQYLPKYLFTSIQNDGLMVKKVLTVSPLTVPISSLMVNTSKRAWVGCSPVPSPALIIGFKQFTATD